MAHLPGRCPEFKHVHEYRKKLKEHIYQKKSRIKYKLITKHLLITKYQYNIEQNVGRNASNSACERSAEQVRRPAKTKLERKV